MAGTIMIVFSALIAGVVLSPGGGHFEDYPGLSALVVVLMLTSLILTIVAAYRVSTDADDEPRVKRRTGGLSRRTTGPRDRRV